MISSIGLEATNVKSQILFNIPLHKYTIIGTLYYDKNLKILGETSVPGFVANSQTFSQSVDSNSVMASILDKTISFLKKNDSPLPADKISTKDLKNKLVPVVSDKNETENVNHDKLFTKTPVMKTPVASSPKDNKQKVTEKIPLRNDPIVKKDQSVKIVYDSSGKKEISKNPIIEKKAIETKPTPLPIVKEPKAEKSYNSKNESNPKSTIFTDGTKYSFQVSSWKNKPKAEEEVQKLKGQNHNAFISEGIVRGKTWYRVRIGFFNSLEETEAYMRKQK
jgi:cell division protein FtsN